MTYDEIVEAAIADNYASARAQILAQIERLVVRAQDYLVNRIDHDEFSQELPPIPVLEDGVVDIELAQPATAMRILEIRSLTWNQEGGVTIPLLPRAQATLRAMYGVPRPGVPRYYARPGVRFRLYPRPYQAGSVSASVNLKPVPLSPAVQTNIFSEKFPLAMQIAVAREVAMFMADETMMALFGGQMADELAAINGQAGRRMRDEASQRPVDTRNVAGS
jgi:hypothetical protein